MKYVLLIALISTTIFCSGSKRPKTSFTPIKIITMVSSQEDLAFQEFFLTKQNQVANIMLGLLTISNIMLITQKWKLSKGKFDGDMMLLTIGFMGCMLIYGFQFFF